MCVCVQYKVKSCRKSLDSRVISLSYVACCSVETVYLECLMLTCLSDYWLELQEEVGTQLKNSFLSFLSWLPEVWEPFQSEP